ncbi:DUF2721 domain-containing protein [Croceicoccus hydrothermalis]|uniref:DUF2721 domain-containing protein n=1 Tax=Croceicoccus hydrothermalis TaxID=2867964 RepID=UPI001EFC2323|nr:DUF2721 domain-containing protein [Croceicoccus hydrothermalis]
MIAQTIQLALAPVFVLVAIGNMLNMLAGRLGRVVDRARTVQALHAATEGSEHDQVVREIRILDRRINLINRAMLLLVLSALSIGLTVVSIFMTAVWHARYDWLDALFFFIALALLMWALGLFLTETRLASASLRIPQELLEWERRL